MERATAGEACFLPVKFLDASSLEGVAPPNQFAQLTQVRCGWNPGRRDMCAAESGKQAGVELVRLVARELARTVGLDARRINDADPYTLGVQEVCKLQRPVASKRLALRYGRLGFIVQALLQTACILLVAGRLAREL